MHRTPNSGFFLSIASVVPVIRALYYLKKIAENPLKTIRQRFIKLITFGHYFVCVLINRVSNIAILIEQLRTFLNLYRVSFCAKR